MKYEHVIIRPLEEKDLDQVCQLEEKNFSMPWKKEDFKEMIDSEIGKYFVLEYENEIVGNAGIRIIVGEGEITNVVIHECYRNQGLGNMLLQELLNYGNSLGVREYTLEVREHNFSAIALYEKSGFVSEGIRKDFYEKPVENALIMWKRN